MNNLEQIVCQYYKDKNGNPMSYHIRRRHQISPKNYQIQLDGIPDEYRGIEVIEPLGLYRVYNADEITEDSYWVRDDGNVFFHKSKACQDVMLDYYSIGLPVVGAGRIYTLLDEEGNVIETLEDILEKGKTVIEALKTMSDVIVAINDLKTSTYQATKVVANIDDAIDRGYELLAKLNAVEYIQRPEYDKDKNMFNKRIDDIINSKYGNMIYILKNREGEYGDCSIIRADDGTFSMIDCMGDGTFPNTKPQLDKIGVDKIEYLFITHDHSDHIGEAVNMIKTYKPKYLVFKHIDYDKLPPIEKQWKSEEYHNKMVEQAKKEGTEIIIADDQTFNIGGDTKVTLYASHYYNYDARDLNTESVNYLVTFKNSVRCMFPGDSTADTEAYLRGKIGKVDFLKMSHHGSIGGNTREWFAELKPNIACPDRTNIFYIDQVENHCLNAKLYGAKIYCKDNNEMLVFMAKPGCLIPLCNEMPFGNKFVKDDNDSWKFFDASGNFAHAGIYPYKTDYYFIKNNSGLVAEDGWNQFQGEHFYAEKGGWLARNKFIKGIDGGKDVYYWIGDDCRWQKSPMLFLYKNNYFIIKDNGQMAQNEWISYDGKQYHAESNGVLTRNNFVTGNDNGKVVYYWMGDDCSWQEKSTIIFFNNNRYLIKDNGQMASGEFYSYQANYYYARSNGDLACSEWIHKDDYWYWLKSNGIMACSETLFIEGKWYDFDENGYCTNPSNGRDTK